MQKWEKRGDQGARNLVVLGRAGRRGGEGCQTTGGGKIGVAWAAPPEKRGRGLGAKRLATRGAGRLRRGTGALEMGFYHHPGAFARTLTPRDFVGQASPRTRPQPLVDQRR